MIHGRHSGVSLNFQAKTPTAMRPNRAPMILAIIIYSPALSTPSHLLASILVRPFVVLRVWVRSSLFMKFLSLVIAVGWINKI